MGIDLSNCERSQPPPAEKAAFESPVPPQTPRQRNVGARITEIADTNGRRLGLDRHGVSNVYCEFGTSFAISAVTNPRFCAAMAGTVINGFGHHHVSRCHSRNDDPLGEIHAPETAANPTFGGLPHNRLYICGGTSLYARCVDMQGTMRP